jgi:hypothetical protein
MHDVQHTNTLEMKSSLLLFGLIPTAFSGDCLVGSDIRVELARNLIGQVISILGRKRVPSNPSPSSPKQVVRGCVGVIFITVYYVLANPHVT